MPANTRTVVLRVLAIAGIAFAIYFSQIRAPADATETIPPCGYRRYWGIGPVVIVIE